MRSSSLGVFCVVLALSLGWRSGAQHSEASCSGDFVWANNDKNQDPCTIGAWLLSPCLGNPGDAIVDALNSTLAPGTYGPPIRPDQCGCSMVYYNIIQACGACQGGRITSWSDYRGDECAASLISVARYPFPIPGGTDVPAWAYMDISGTNTFDVNAAKSFAASNDTMFSATPSASSTAVSSSASSSASLASSASSTSSSTSSTTSTTSSGTAQTASAAASAPHKSTTAAIAGGAAGGAVLVAAALALVLWRRRARRSSARTLEPGVVHGAEYCPAPGVPSDTSSKVYNPDDPSTFPGPPMRALPYAGGRPAPAGYSGAAEI